MDKQILEEILKRIQLLEKFCGPHSFLGIDYRVWPAIAVIISLVIALFVPWYAERLRRRPRKNNLAKIGTSTNIQEDELYVGRLIIRNQSNVRAVNVEAYVESIVDNGIKRDNYLPVPLYWTHSQLYKSPILRDIFGNQTVYLDIFNYKAISDGDIYKLTSPIGHVRDYCDLKLGETELHIRLYQESGQVVREKVTISWEKGKLPKFINENNL
jgi:hypothetical protein